MTAPSDTRAAEPTRERAWLLPVKLGAAGFLLLMAMGATTGAAVAANERGWTSYRIAVVTGFALLAMALAAWLVRLVQRRPHFGPEARNIGTARRLTIASGAVGGLMGALLAIPSVVGGGVPEVWSIFSSAPLPPPVAAILLAAIALIIPVSWVWHRSIDEHEEAAYRFGSLIGINVYFYLSAGWWIAARGGFVPAVDGQAIFFVTIMTWGLGWTWARFR